MEQTIISLHKQGINVNQISKKLNLPYVNVWRIINPEKNKTNRKKWCKVINDRKLQAKIRLGGKCAICGYSKSHWVLVLHHKDESTKTYKLKREGTLGGDWRKLSFADFEAELQKCVLLCENCHQEVHHGITELPK